MVIAYFDCFSGISGDMILGSLADLIDDPSYIQNELKKIDLKDYSISFKKVKRAGIETTKADIQLADKTQPFRNLPDIVNIISASSLPENIKSNSIKIFKRLGEAEAAVHGTDIDKVHFHEVGAIDSIIDIVGSVIGLNYLNISKIFSSPVNTGSGVVKCAHGTMPVPAPAVIELLKGVPCFSSGAQRELTTPTGAAVITALAKEFCALPKLKAKKIGYGAGMAELKETPNALRIILGESEDNNVSGLPETGENIFVLETNIDDMNPEFYELVMEKLFQAGAIDVFLTPIIMKKNRPATKLSLLTQQKNIEPLAKQILRNTTSFGVRFYPARRIILERETKEIETAFGKVKVKVGKRDKEIYHISPEYDKCKEISQKQDIPLKKVYEEIQIAISKHFSV